MSRNTFWIGWRLLTARGESLGQAALVAFGVAIASSLLFALASIPGAVSDRQERDAKREWVTSGEPATVPGDDLVAVGRDLLANRPMTHLLISADADPEVVGIDPIPESGSALVSSALRNELSSNPSLIRRIQGQVVGFLPEGFLLEPSELVSVSVVEAVEMLATGEARVLPSEVAPLSDVQISSDVAYVVTVALLVLALPVAFFVSSATRFGLERRRHRIRVLGLVGADRTQVRTFVLVETVLAALVGLVGGYSLFLLLRPLLAMLRVGGRATFLESLQPTATLTLAVVGFVVVAAVMAALAGSRRLETSPLDATRWRGRTTPGLVILALGLTGLVVGVAAPSGTDAPHPLALAGMVLTAIGLALASRLSTESLGRWLGNRTGDGPTLLAARRMDRTPGEVNRPLTAVVTGVLMVTAFFTITGTLLRSSNPRYEDLPATQVVVEAEPQMLTRITDQLVGHPGVEAVAIEGLVSVMGPGWSSPGLGVVANCEALTRVVDMVTEGCGSGVVVAASERVPVGSPITVGSAPPLSESTATVTVETDGSTFEGDFPASVIIAPDVVGEEFLAAISEAQALVRFDPITGDLEGLRTFVVSTAPTARVRTVSEIEFEFAVSAREVRLLAIVGLMVIFGVAVFSLIVGTASHLLQQRNALAFLRAGGLLPVQIRKLLAFESIVPLGFSAAIGAVFGVGVGAAIAISAGTDPSIPWGSVGFIYLGAVGLAVLVWAAFVPTLDRLTSPTGLRFE